MAFLKNLFKKKDEPIKSYNDFWAWFQANERSFHTAVKAKDRIQIERDFFDKLSPKLKELRDGFFFLAGMAGDDKAELVFTADGTIKNIVFMEEIVDAAPEIDGWLFTALKPEMEISKMSINMGDYQFSSDNISFYANNDPEFPDEINLTFVHEDYTEENRDLISNGTYIFLDNVLGELKFITTIDEMNVVGKADAESELIPLDKLKDFLIWREKEFIEKYEGKRQNTENDEYAGMEAELQNGNKMLAIINTNLLQWENKASHPWIMVVEIKYDGSKTNGMPDEDTYQLLNKIEDEILQELKDIDGYLNIGRQTAEGLREIYFACNDFRKPSKVLSDLLQQYASVIDITYDIYKDKYWTSFNRFISY